MVQLALARALAVLMLFMDLDAPSHLPLHLQYALSMGNSRSLPRLLSFFFLFSRTPVLSLSSYSLLGSRCVHASFSLIFTRVSRWLNFLFFRRRVPPSVVGFVTS